MLDWGPPQRPPFNIITSLKTLSPNMILGVRIPTGELEGFTP